ncbi:phospholipase D-like domain-containing protein, partial [Enterobacter hormaechei]|nr:phospholipase D-like domain-containing protein [Enterobacter hormaechei]
SHCRIWRASGNFNHSKLLAIDGQWAYVGSSNLDPRSLRLNFEVDLEIMDAAFAEKVEGLIETAIETAKPVLLQSLRARSFWVRL